MRKTHEVVKYDRYSSLKSKGEREIASFFDSVGIAYDYEYPLAVVDHGKTKIWYPDFRLRQYGVIVEYFGMNGNSHYNDMMTHKLRVYREAGFDGIFLLDSTMRGPWQERLVDRIEQGIDGKKQRIGNVRERVKAPKNNTST